MFLLIFVDSSTLLLNLVGQWGIIEYGAVNLS